MKIMVSLMTLLYPIQMMIKIHMFQQQMLASLFTSNCKQLTEVP